MSMHGLSSSRIITLLCRGPQDRERKRQKLADEAADAYIGADLSNGGGGTVVSPADEEPVKPQV